MTRLINSSRFAVIGGGNQTFYPSAQAGYVESQSYVDEPTANSGGGSLFTTTGSLIRVGFYYTAGEEWEFFDYLEGFIDFSLASLTGTVNTASLSLGLAFDASALDFTVQARTKDWGSTLTEADWVPGSSLSALPLLATLATSGIGSVDTYKTFTQNGTALKDAVVAAGTGNLRILLCSSAQISSSWSNDVYVNFHAYNHATLKPKLEITTV